MLNFAANSQQMTTNYAKLYGLIGFPLGHSFSQGYFNQKFEAENIDARYINFEIPEIDDLNNILARNPNLAGLNVTIPYKQQVIDKLDEMDPEAAEIGAVNVIKFIRRNGKLILKGYNSDIIGFRDSIAPLLTDHHTAALILGTGGASRAVSYALRSLGIETQLVSRSQTPGVITYSDLTPEIINRHKIIVNTTPLGMYPHVDECPDIPYHLLTSRHLCYDLLYNPDVTLFMKKSAEAGAEIKNGLEMLLLQAFAAWQIWQR